MMMYSSEPGFEHHNLPMHQWVPFTFIRFFLFQIRK